MEIFHFSCVIHVDTLKDGFYTILYRSHRLKYAWLHLFQPKVTCLQRPTVAVYRNSCLVRTKLHIVHWPIVIGSEIACLLLSDAFLGKSFHPGQDQLGESFHPRLKWLGESFRPRLKWLPQCFYPAREYFHPGLNARRGVFSAQGSHFILGRNDWGSHFIPGWNDWGSHFGPGWNDWGFIFWGSHFSPLHRPIYNWSTAKLLLNFRDKICITQDNVVQIEKCVFQETFPMSTAEEFA